MKRERKQPTEGEEALDGTERPTSRTTPAPSVTPEATEGVRPLHEPRACQAKVEMQNGELQRARLAVENSRENCDDLYDFAPVGYFTLDDRGVVTETNHTGKDLLGVTHANLEGRRFSIFLAEQSRAGFKTFLEEVLAGGRQAVYEAALGGGAHVQWVRICGRAVQTRENEPRRCRIAVTDITAIRDAEEEREFLRAQILQTLRLESLGVLVGGIAHDFNNMLMIISGNARLVLEELPEDSPARPMVGEIVTVSGRAADLCAQMLSHAGNGHSQMAPLSLSTMAAEIIGLLAVSMTKKARISGRLCENLPPVLADAVQMRQVLMNLIINASEALDESGGTILVSTGIRFCDREFLARARAAEPLKEGYHVFLEVAGTVGGMNLDILERMFAPSFSAKFPGRHPGLAGVTGVIHAHAGGIYVDSRAGRDATITLLLPPAQAVVAADPDPPALPVGWKGKGTVLLVDDEDSVRLVCKHMLECLGLDVLAAKDGQEAIKTFREHREEIGCVLLDFAMPRLNGEETFRELHRIAPEARVILSSGYLLDDVMARFEGEGLAGFIHKPYLMEQLVDAMKKIFAN